MDDFGFVFNRMITERNPNALETLSASTPLPPVEAAPDGADCAFDVSGCVDELNQNPIICNYCASGVCGKERRGAGGGGLAFTCVPSDWTPPPPPPRSGRGGGGGGGGGGGRLGGRPPRNLRSI
jgi:hypothetical protein